ncbi:laminin subunit alpha-5 [Choloepus didactylus]|uniref:laminin subunit alpha-5 n=1 Tax=Choloepus didactylus TaxID=27675 RepID=UPI00189C9791|nr:laminin subunit alpha-5 [Choloepus didactylus]
MGLGEQLGCKGPEQEQGLTWGHRSSCRLGVQLGSPPAPTCCSLPGPQLMSIRALVCPGAASLGASGEQAWYSLYLTRPAGRQPRPPSGEVPAGRGPVLCREPRPPGRTGPRQAAVTSCQAPSVSRMIPGRWQHYPHSADRDTEGQYCDICTAASSNKAHPASNAIDGTERWWQSPPLSRGLEYNEVNVTLDLGQVFHVAYVLVKFANSPRPDLWVLERSTDFGRTYQPWQYFASSKRDCLERFGPRTLERIVRDDDVICATDYSRIVPLENGEIVVSLVNGRPGARNFSYSPLLRDFTKATNIRLRFLRTNTLLGHLMGKALRDPTVTRRYYYSIKDISIGGRCVCHGHADVCDAKDPTDPYRLLCACQHNTCGGSCDRCCPGFSQQPWRPATPDSAHECQPCNCHGHAHDCYYDAEVDRRNASQNQDLVYQGGGVCIECQHHTTGVNCERCLPGFYRAPDHALDSPHVCRRCDCDSDFTDGTCEDLTGRCYCRPGFTGERCTACAEGFAGFPRCLPVSLIANDTGEQVLPAGQIVNCDCNAAGTQGNACRKDVRLGRCVCKPNFQGAHCELCTPGFFGPGCQPCQCSSPGVASGECDRDSGQCTCRTGFTGAACERCAPDYFNFPLCHLCGCSPAGTLPEGCDEAGRCPCRPGFDGPHCDRCRPGYHGYPDCHACTCDPSGALDQVCGAGGLCHCRPSYAGPTCQECAPGFHGFPDCVSCHCSADGSLHAACDPQSGQCSCRPHVTGLRCDACVPGAYNFPSCEAGSCHPAGLALADPAPPEANAPCTCRAHVEGLSCDRCKPGFWGLNPSNPEGCTRCSCDPRGTLGGMSECQQGSGQCFCKPHVCGRACAACRDGFFGLDQADYFGCHSCRCDVGGALGQGCEPRTGTCRCRPHTRGPTCQEPAQDHFLPDMHHLRLELEEAATPEGRAVRFGFNPLEFESFSWRGYAQMSAVQPRVSAQLNVTSPDLFRLVLRYVNRSPSRVSGRVSVREDGRFATCANCECPGQCPGPPPLPPGAPHSPPACPRCPPQPPSPPACPRCPPLPPTAPSLSPLPPTAPQSPQPVPAAPHSPPACPRCPLLPPTAPSLSPLPSTAPQPVPAVPCCPPQPPACPRCPPRPPTAPSLSPLPPTAPHSHPLPTRLPWPLSAPSPAGTEQSQPVVLPPSAEPAFVTVPQRGFGEPFVLNPGSWALLAAFLYPLFLPATLGSPWRQAQGPQGCWPALEPGEHRLSLCPEREHAAAGSTEAGAGIESASRANACPGHPAASGTGFDPWERDGRERARDPRPSSVPTYLVFRGKLNPPLCPALSRNHPFAGLILKNREFKNLTSRSKNLSAADVQPFRKRQEQPRH